MSYLHSINPALANLAHLVHIRQYRAKDGSGSYDVETSGADHSRRIRSAYGEFWRRRRGQQAPQMPASLRGVSITISHTFQTRVRVKIMKEIAKRHQAVNAELSVFVTGFTPRPVLKVREPRGQSSRVTTFSFTEAVQRFSHHLTPEFLADCSRFAHTNLSLDSLQPTFLVLSPDFIQSHNPVTPERSNPAPKRFASDVQTPATKRPAANIQSSLNPIASGSATEDPSLALSNQFQALASPEQITVNVSPSSVVLRQSSFTQHRQPENSMDLE